MKVTGRIFLIVIWVFTGISTLLAQWVQSDGHINPLVYSLVVNGNTLLAGTDTIGIFFSTNGGESWSFSNAGLDIPAVRSLAITGNKIFAGVGEGIPIGNGGVFSSSDNGLHWQRATSGSSNRTIFQVNAMDSIVLAGSWGGGVYRSQDSGSTWFSDTITALSAAIRSFAIGDTVIFAGSDLGGVFRSKRLNVGWTSVSSGLTNRYIYALIMVDLDLFAGTLGGGIFLSTNAGDTWVSMNNGLTNKYVHCLSSVGNNLIAGTTSGGLFISSDKGTSWNSINNGLPNVDILAIQTLGQNLFVATYGAGVWRRPLSEITSVEVPLRNIPTQFSLGQNYPNPFNPMTIIEFGIPSASFVSLKIFNAIGCEVTTLISRELAAGFHSQQWNAEAMPSGVYFYRLQAGIFSATKKLILIR